MSDLELLISENNYNKLKKGGEDKMKADVELVDELIIPFGECAVKTKLNSRFLMKDCTVLRKPSF